MEKELMYRVVQALEGINSNLTRQNQVLYSIRDTLDLMESRIALDEGVLERIADVIVDGNRDLEKELERITSAVEDCALNLSLMELNDK